MLDNHPLPPPPILPHRPKITPSIPHLTLPTVSEWSISPPHPSPPPQPSATASLHRGHCLGAQLYPYSSAHVTFSHSEWFYANPHVIHPPLPIHPPPIHPFPCLQCNNPILLFSNFPTPPCPCEINLRTCVCTFHSCPCLLEVLQVLVNRQVFCGSTYTCNHIHFIVTMNFFKKLVCCFDLTCGDYI